MKVRVLYFATLRDLAGRRQEELALPAGATVGQLRERLAEGGGRLAAAVEGALFAVNREFAFPEEELNEGDEVAVFPPVSGGAEDALLVVGEQPLDLDELLASMVMPTTGAACVFSGVVRGETAGEAPHLTEYLEYEAYKPMAEAKLRQVADEIHARWPGVEKVAIVQRIGRLDPGTPTVLIACTGAHRDQGIFEAARYGIDRLKQIVPIWKREVGPDGSEWVEGDYRPGPEDRRPG